MAVIMATLIPPRWIIKAKAPRSGLLQISLIKASWTGVNHFGQNRTIELFVPGTEKEQQ